MTSLSWNEVLIAAVVGVRRHVNSRAKAIKDLHGLRDADRWDVDIEGACGELAFCKCMGWYWPAHVNDLGGKLGDANGVQVRTASDPNDCLIVRRDNDPDQAYVLVVGHCPVYEIKGWMLGGDAMQEKYLRDPGGRGGAYFVPQADLNALKLLGAKRGTP